VREAALIRGLKIYGADCLNQVIKHLNERSSKQLPAPVLLTPAAPTTITLVPESNQLDFSEIKGQATAKRGLEIAAAGGHNLAMNGPPGTGKTMLAKAFAGILPPLQFDDIIEVTGIHSAAGALTEELLTQPPFRSPHHTASYVSLVGGGGWPKPGEITLAHRGVLFLD